MLSEGKEEEESEARRKKGKEKEANQSPEDDEDSVSSNHETIDGWSAPVLEPPLGSDEKEEGDYQRVTLVHESLMKHTKKQTKKKHVRDDETREMRDRRTIFVGNLPLEILSKKVRIFFFFLYGLLLFHGNFFNLAIKETTSTTCPFLRPICQN